LDFVFDLFQNIDWMFLASRNPTSAATKIQPLRK